jgi:DNA-binding NtrC family response regulator
MMNVDAVAGRLPLVLVVDPLVASRHRLWRVLHRAFGVLEAEDLASARAWISRRPGIDAVLVHQSLPDGSGSDLAREMSEARHPAADRVLVMDDPEGMHGLVARLASWVASRDSVGARTVLREAERMFA